jgi:hypothetical protein
LTCVSPISEADGFDLVRQVEKAVPGVFEDGLIVFEDAIGQPVLAQELPDILHRVQFRRACRQQDRHDVAGNPETAGGVPSGPIEQEHRASAMCDLARDDIEMGLHGLGVGGGHDESGARVPRGTDGTEQEGAVVALVFGLARPRSFARPQAREAVLLADPRLVLEPDLDRRIPAQVASVGGERGGEVFMNASTTPRSWAGCRDPALRCEKPSSSRRREIERSE